MSNVTHYCEMLKTLTPLERMEMFKLRARDIVPPPIPRCDKVAHFKSGDAWVCAEHYDMCMEAAAEVAELERLLPTQALPKDE